MFEFTKEQKMIRSMVREFAQNELAPKTLELDQKAEFPHDFVRKLGDQGLIGIISAKEFGGAAASHVSCVIAVEELARVYPSLAFILEVIQAGIHLIESHGTEEQKKKLLPPIIRGNKVVATASTEPSGGSALSAMATEAVTDGDGYVINGRKIFITNGGVADYCIVLAKTGEQASMFMVEKGTPGFIVSRRQKLMGIKTGDVSELAFTACKVSKDNLIGKEGGGLSLAASTFAVSRASVAAVGLGLAQGACEVALQYAKERILYGKPIANLQAIQFMLADMETEIEAARWLIYYPAACLDRGMEPRNINKYSARAKAVSADLALGVTQKAIQILGGYGVSPEYHLARLLSDAMVIFPATGTNQIMKIIQASEIVGKM